MSHIHIERPHTLGLPEARRLARRWAEKVARDHGLHCSVDEGESADRLHFNGAGATGTLDVTAERFCIDLQLGLLMGMFAGAIEAQLSEKLDRQIAKAEAERQGVRA